MKSHLLKFVSVVLLSAGFLSFTPTSSYADVALINGGGFRVTIATNRSSDPSAGTWASYSAGTTTIWAYDPGYGYNNCSGPHQFPAAFFPEPQWGSGALAEGTMGQTISSVWNSGVYGTYIYNRAGWNTSLSPSTCRFYATNYFVVVGTDAYDYAYALWVDVNGSGEVQFSGNGSATLEDAGREVVIGTQTIGGVEITRKIYVPSSEPWIRHLIIVYNPSASAHTVDLLIQSNFGADGKGYRTGALLGTTVRNYSNGGNPWVFTNIDGVGASDPMDAYVNRNGYGDGDNWRWNNISLAPGATKVYQFFAGGTALSNDAFSIFTAIKGEPPSLNVGMSTLELDSVQNWNSPNTVLGGPSVYDLAPVKITFPTITGEGTTTVTPVTTPVPPKRFQVRNA